MPVVGAVHSIKSGLSEGTSKAKSPTSSTRECSNLTKELTPHLGSDEIALGHNAIENVLYVGLGTIPMELLTRNR